MRKDPLKGPDSIDQEEHEKFVEELFDSGTWNMFCRRLCPIMGLDEVALISYLFSLAAYAGESRKEGWFHATTTKLAKELAISAKQQYSLLRKLREKGFIEIQMRGVMPKRKRWLRINKKALREKAWEAYLLRRHFYVGSDELRSHSGE